MEKDQDAAHSSAVRLGTNREAGDDGVIINYHLSHKSHVHVD